GKPERAVAADRDADRRRLCGRQVILGEAGRGWIEAADFCVAALAEPERAVGTFDANVWPAVGGRDLVLADGRRRFAAQPVAGLAAGLNVRHVGLRISRASRCGDRPLPVAAACNGPPSFARGRRRPQAGRPPSSSSACRHAATYFRRWPTPSPRSHETAARNSAFAWRQSRAAGT